MPSQRLARQRRKKFEALAAYANMRDKPEAWDSFRVRYPEFFPVAPSGFRSKGFENLSALMYDFAISWHNEFIDYEAGRNVLPPLLWYRNRLRAVWSRNDHHGYNLAILLGFEEEAKRIAAEHPGEVASDLVIRPLAIPGQPFNPLKQQSEGLPPGRPIINGVTGDIGWKFGCELQQSVHELMHERWRTKICPQCGKFFVALTTAQKLCSDDCSNAAIQKRSKDWWWDNKAKDRGANAKSKARTK